MADGPKPVAGIGTGLPLYGSRVVELVMVDMARLDSMEGAEVRLCAGGRPLGHGGYLRPCSARALAVRDNRGRIEVLLSAPLGTLVPAATYGDGVYLADDVADWERQDERAFVEAWKAGKEA